MANEEHVEIIKKGPKAWNNWRKENPEMVLDLSNADLIKANLIGADMRGADLFGADMRGAYLRRADMRGAYLRRANLSGARLMDANLEDADMEDANLEDAKLIGANLSGAYMIGADMEDANLEDAKLIGANLIGANLSGAYMIGADMSNTNLEEAILIDVNWGVVISPEQKESLWEKVKEKALQPDSLNQATWHTCSTKHCLSGWAEVLAPKILGIDSRLWQNGPAGYVLLPERVHHFFYNVDTSDVIQKIKVL